MPGPLRIQRVRLPALLASTSVVALLMGGTAPAVAQCANYIGTTAAGCTNTDTISPSLIISNSTINGGIVNSGTITPGGIVITNSTINDAGFIGGIVNGDPFSAAGTGIITGGISIDQTSSIVGLVGIYGESFSGNLSNAGTITLDDRYSRGGIDVAPSSSFTGNIINTGTINVGLLGHSESGAGIQVSNLNGLATFAGGISNGGSITVKGVPLGSDSNCVAYGIAVLGNQGSAANMQSFTGGISNGGSIIVSASGGTGSNNNAIGIDVDSVATFAGGISNAGAINVSLSTSNLNLNAANGIEATNISTFTGGIVNTGSITVSASGSGAAEAIAIDVQNVSTFTGGIANTGTIVTTGAGYGSAGISARASNFVGDITNGPNASIKAQGSGLFGIGIDFEEGTFLGSIRNAGTITTPTGTSLGSTVGYGIFVLNATFSGSIINTGSISGSVGIAVTDASTLNGSIINTGTINASVAGIAAVNSAPVSVFDSGTIVGTGGTAVDLTQNAAGNTFTLGPGYSITGKVLGQGSDTFQLGGTGTGSFDLSTIGATQQYQGFTTFNVVGGTWIASNSFGQSQAWNVNGGTLAGTGTFSSINVNNGGTLAPGTPGVAGTFMTVNGNLAFQSGATYLTNINPATASLANVSGTATLAGAAQGFIAPASYSTKTTYDILNASSISGAFTGFTGSNAPGFSGTLTYTPSSVLLNLTANLGGGAGLTGNQKAVAMGINSAFNNGATLPASFFPLFTLSGGALGNVLGQLAGESATGSEQTTFQAMTQFMDLLTDPFSGRAGGINGSTPPTGYAEEGEASAYSANRRTTDAFAMFTKAPAAVPFVPRWSVWASGYGGSQSTSGNAALGSNDTTSRIAGTAVGADYQFSPNTLAGFALAGGGTSFAVNTIGSGRSDLFQAGAYVRHTQGNAYITGALAYGWQDVTTNRTVGVAGLDQLRAEFNANAYSGRLEGGYRFVAPWTGGIGITPYAAGQFTTFELPAYAESVVTGSPNFALAYGAQSVTDARSELGIRTDKSFAIQNGILTLRGRLAWAHDFDPNRSIGATFQALPGPSFVVNGAAQASESALTTASVEMKWTNNWSAAATFEGEFSNVTLSYAGKGTVRYTW